MRGASRHRATSTNSAVLTRDDIFPIAASLAKDFSFVRAREEQVGESQANYIFEVEGDLHANRVAVFQFSSKEGDMTFTVRICPDPPGFRAKRWLVAEFLRPDGERFLVRSDEKRTYLIAPELHGLTRLNPGHYRFMDTIERELDPRSFFTAIREASGSDDVDARLSGVRKITGITDSREIRSATAKALEGASLDKQGYCWVLGELDRALPPTPGIWSNQVAGKLAWTPHLSSRGRTAAELEANVLPAVLDTLVLERQTGKIDLLDQARALLLDVDWRADDVPPIRPRRGGSAGWVGTREATDAYLALLTAMVEGSLRWGRVDLIETYLGKPFETPTSEMLRLEAWRLLLFASAKAYNQENPWEVLQRIRAPKDGSLEFANDLIEAICAKWPASWVPLFVTTLIDMVPMSIQSRAEFTIQACRVDYRRTSDWRSSLDRDALRIAAPELDQEFERLEAYAASLSRGIEHWNDD